MSHHGQRFAVINGERRHVIVLKLFMLIIAENDHDIRIGLLQAISQRLNRFLARFIALPKLFGREFTVKVRFRSLAADFDSLTAGRARPFLAGPPNHSRARSTADCAMCRYLKRFLPWS